MQRSRFLVAFLLTCLIPFGVFASSHREAPQIAEDPTVDNTDLYVFRSPDAPGMVTIIANYYPFQEPAGGPNFHHPSESALYEIHIDNNGDAKEDVTYQFRFRDTYRNLDTFLYNTGPVTSLDDPDLNYRQFYTVNRITGSRRGGSVTSLGNQFQTAPANIGPKSTPSYEALANQAVGNLPDGGKVFSGPRDDPFFVDLGSIFDLLTLRPIQQLHKVPPMAASAPGVDGLKGYNVSTIAIQVPISALTAGGTVPSGPTATNAIVGVWATASRSRVSFRTGGTNPRVGAGGSTQVSRLGNPLVNEAVLSLRYKDIFNSIEPSVDATVFTTDETFRNRVLDPEVPKLINALYGVNVPPAPRNDLVSVFLTGVEGLNKPANVTPAEMMRINLAIAPAASANRLGVIAGDTAGFPNGRRLSDDVVDIVLQVAAGKLVTGFDVAPNNALTDGVDANDRGFLNSFPYVALPHQGFESRPHAN